MKKYLKICFIVVIAIMMVNVDAMQYKTVEIFPVSESATVTTETFTYTDFIYVPALEGRRYGTIDFKSITNKTDKTIPVSVNILMFDKNKKNIGFLTYCSEKDISGDYGQMKIKPNATSEFSINVSDTYFVEGKTAKDIGYLAVLDDNKYCHIGGYTNYAGMTIEEISKRNSVYQDNEKIDVSKINIKKIVSTTITIIVLLIIGRICIRLFLKFKDKKREDILIKNTNSNDVQINNNSDSGERINFIKEEIEENMVDLNYYNSSLDSSVQNMENNTSSTNMNNNINSNVNNKPNNKDGESDLAKFFR